MLRFLFALILILFASSGLHYFVYLTISRSFVNPLVFDVFLTVFTISFLSIPLGFFTSRAHNPKWQSISWIGFIWMGTFNIFFFLSLIEIPLFLVFNHGHSEWVLYFGITIAAWSLFKGLKLPTIITHELPSSHLRGLSLVQLSDLHMGLLHHNSARLKKIVTNVLSLKPDILVITGDLVEGDYKVIHQELDVLKDTMSIAHRFYITGNHEYLHGGAIWEAKLKELGFQVLHNANQIIEFGSAKLLMAGVPDRTVRHFQNDGLSQPDLALKSPTRVDYKILLAHQPSSVLDLKNESCDLILSGHTHGGQLFPFHLVVYFLEPVVSGFKKIKNTQVFTHQGTGLWGPPMRWFSRNEIVLFKWK